MGMKITWEKKKKKKVSEEQKMMKHRIQYTKVAMNIILALVCVLSLGGLYINLKNGSNMDAIVVEAWGTLWKCIAVYGVKSFAETYAEKSIKFKEMERGDSE